MRGRAALVTGAASGIGASVAALLSKAGANVALFDVDEAAGNELASRIGGIFIKCDVSNYDEFAEAVGSCINQFGVPSFVHLNAGVTTVGPHEPFLAIEEVSLSQLRHIVGVNFNGVFNGLKLLIPRMQKGGAITTTSSIAGLAAVPFDPLYCATKHAVIGLVRSVAAANEGTKLRINCICPGSVDTTIIPDAVRSGGIKSMPPSEIATEILDMLTSAPNGEVRVKRTDQAAYIVDAMQISVDG
jgi:NAD(P)-dependent dehydrogenase (short-subunit alcohol dehydrogenase family)